MLASCPPQMECIRKDIQTFLILRALHKSIVALSTFSRSSGIPNAPLSSPGGTAVPPPPPAVVPELCASIKDKDFLCLEETNIVQPAIADG